MQSKNRIRNTNTNPDRSGESVNRAREADIAKAIKVAKGDSRELYQRFVSHLNDATDADIERAVQRLRA